jgi:hypothetical protein
MRWPKRKDEFYCIIIVPYLLTPWSRVLLEKLTVNLAASQEIPMIYIINYNN